MAKRQSSLSRVIFGASSAALLLLLEIGSFCYTAAPAAYAGESEASSEAGLEAPFMPRGRRRGRRRGYYNYNRANQAAMRQAQKQAKMQQQSMMRASKQGQMSMARQGQMHPENYYIKSYGRGRSQGSAPVQSVQTTHTP